MVFYPCSFFLLCWFSFFSYFLFFSGISKYNKCWFGSLYQWLVSSAHHGLIGTVYLLKQSNFHFLILGHLIFISKSCTRAHLACLLLQDKWVHRLYDLSTSSWSCYWSVVWCLANATWLGKPMAGMLPNCHGLKVHDIEIVVHFMVQIFFEFQMP